MPTSLDRPAPKVARYRESRASCPPAARCTACPSGPFPTECRRADQAPPAGELAPVDRQSVGQPPPGHRTTCSEGPCRASIPPRSLHTKLLSIEIETKYQQSSTDS